MVRFVTDAVGRADQLPSAQRVSAGLVYGGTLGGAGRLAAGGRAAAAAVRAGVWGVGHVEEAAGLATPWLAARGLARYAARDGIVLGAAVGFGLAALEGAGHALNWRKATSATGRLQPDGTG